MRLNKIGCCNFRGITLCYVNRESLIADTGNATGSNPKHRAQERGQFEPPHYQLVNGVFDSMEATR